MNIYTNGHINAITFKSINILFDIFLDDQNQQENHHIFEYMTLSQFDTFKESVIDILSYINATDTSFQEIMQKLHDIAQLAINARNLAFRNDIQIATQF